MAGSTYSVPGTGEGKDVTAGVELGIKGTGRVAAGTVFPHPDMIADKRVKTRRLRMTATCLE
jgi:hypothetical protein